jgi:hypothetical protein
MWPLAVKKSLETGVLNLGSIRRLHFTAVLAASNKTDINVIAIDGLYFFAAK